jgi:hypothetical protein
MAITTDSAGDSHIAYVGDGLFYATNASGSWTTRPIATTGYESQPRIAIDGAGAVHIIFTHRVDTEYEGIYHATNAGGSWYVELLLADNLLENGVDMKMTADGTMHLAWGGSPVGYSGSLFYAKYAAGLLKVTNISTTQRAGRSGASLVIAPNGSAWVAYESSVSGNCGIEVLTNSGGSWHVAATGIGGCGGQVPTLGVESDGKVHVLWYSPDNFGIIDSYADGSGTVRSLGPSSESFVINFSPVGVPAMLVERSHSGSHYLTVVRGAAVLDEVNLTSTDHFVADELVFPLAIAVDTAGKRHVVFSDTEFSSDHLIYATDANGSFERIPMDWPIVGDPAPITTPLSAPAFFGRLGTDGSVPIVTNWQPTTAGSVGFDIARSTDGAAFVTVGSPATNTWSQSLLSGRRYQHRVRSRYGGGATSVWVTDGQVTLARFEETATNLTFSGTWTRVASSAASGGALKTTTKPGSSITITTSARTISLVATTGRRMALVKVYVNGALFRTVDLKRVENNVTRRLVWVGQFTTAQTRTIKFVAAKKGTRVRVDFDAVVAFV